MLRALLLSIAQLGDPPVLRVLAQSLAVTLALFAALGAGLWWLVDAALAGRAYHGALAGAAAVAGSALAFWLLFRAIAILVIGLFADRIVAAVERRHYPAAAASARDVPLTRGLGMGLGSAARFVAINLLLLPLYAALLVTGIGTAVVFFLVNAWLLGRDLGDMVAARHLPRAAMRDWRAATVGRRYALGLAGTALFVVPLLNVLVPVLGAAMATHLYHGTRR